MNRPLLYILLLMFASFISCERESGIAEESEDAVSLEIFLSVPEVSISTKGMEDPWDEDLTDWTNWDIFTDGRAIYELTLLLINSDGDLVGFRDMYAPGSGDNEYVDSANGIWDGSQVLDESTVSGKEFKASFLYDTPQGGRSVEKLKRGVYTLLAVSNYRPITASVTGTTAYEGLKGAIGSSKTIDTPFTNIIEGIETEYIANNGITDFKNSTLYQNLWTFNIVTDYNNLCHRQPQPLTAVREIELIPGKNTIHLGLERTYVRVRVEIENNSSVAELTVNDFDFCDWFTQRAVYLFNDPKDNSRNYDISNTGLNTSKQSPILKNETGVVNDKDINGNDYSNAITDLAKSSQRIAPGTSMVIFDGYIFGSKLGATDPSTYQYKLDVEYTGKTYQTPHSLPSQTPISDITDISAGLYLIEMVRNPAFLYVTEADNLATNSTLDNILSEMSRHTYRYVWELEDRDGGGYYLRNLEEDVYADYPDDNPLVITLLGKNENNYFQLSNMTGGIQIKGTNSMCFNQHNWTNSYGFPVTNWYENDNGNPCVFYPVKEGEMLDARFNQNVNLELIDPQTSSVYPVQNIKRNDFINILISATYVPTANQFKIENMVKGWTTKDMEIEFH